MQLAEQRAAAQESHTTARARTTKQSQSGNNLDLHRVMPRNRRCNCGACATCQDNARWERIFAEKFEDPYYYSDLPLRHASPLRVETH